MRVQKDLPLLENVIECVCVCMCTLQIQDMLYLNNDKGSVVSMTFPEKIGLKFGVVSHFQKCL